jgi:hypothetical protein
MKPRPPTGTGPYTVGESGPAWCVRDAAGQIVPDTLRDSRVVCMDIADRMNGVLVPGRRDWLIRLERLLAEAKARVSA